MFGAIPSYESAVRHVQTTTKETNRRLPANVLNGAKALERLEPLERLELPWFYASAANLTLNVEL
jgi:hypothetical protein